MGFCSGLPFAAIHCPQLCSFCVESTEEGYCKYHACITGDEGCTDRHSAVDASGCIDSPCKWVETKLGCYQSCDIIYLETCSNGGQCFDVGKHQTISCSCLGPDRQQYHGSRKQPCDDPSFCKYDVPCPAFAPLCPCLCQYH